MRHKREAIRIREGNVTMSDIWMAEYQSRKIVRKATVRKDEKMFFPSSKAYYRRGVVMDIMTTA